MTELRNMFALIILGAAIGGSVSPWIGFSAVDAAHAGSILALVPRGFYLVWRSIRSQERST